MNLTGFISSSFTLNTVLVVITVPAYVHTMKQEIPTLRNSGKVLIYVQLMAGGFNFTEQRDGADGKNVL